MISVVIIDDHPLAVNGIGAWLRGTGRFTIAGAAGTLAEARALFERLPVMPEIVILDISLGSEDGLTLIPALRELCEKRGMKEPGVIVCSMYEDPFLVQRAIASGAAAYTAKSADMGEILTAIDAVLEGKSYVNPKYRVEAQNRPRPLSPREIEIVSLVKQSLSSAQIAKRLGISVRTVENHLSHIYDKTGAASRAELFDL